MRTMLADAVDGYVAYRRTAYKPGTAALSESAMRNFLAVVGNIQTRSLEPRHAERYQSWLIGRGMAPNTINSRMAQLSRFSSWAVSHRMVPTSFVGTVRNVPVPKVNRLRIPVTEFGRLLDAATRPDHRITVAIGLFAFLRDGEIKTLRVGDVDLDEQELSVTIHKSNTTDCMPITSDLDRELRRWLIEYARDQRPLRATDYLVPSRHRFKGWEPLPDTGLYQPQVAAHRPHHHVQAVLRAAGYIDRMTKGEGVHTLRRSGARAFYDGLIEGRVGDPAARDDALRIVMAALHHANTTITEHYLGLSRDRQKRDRVLKGLSFVPATAENVVPLRQAASN